MKPLRQIADFLRGIRIDRRFGEISRSPLKLLRFQLQGERAEVDWLARVADDIVGRGSAPAQVREQNFSFQALQDAMVLRKMLFDLLPDVCVAELRAFRQSGPELSQLIIFGTVNREASGCR